eukprot:CAMPEP_0175055576 /NCGR_PEP_ID=MMETSP0052_2-20121109/10166_1 /TAXON_ID=51329 ORGANISM="Polytomella parva, Strain SAG 63-3" /NCGR_SAMPLE_ID=MMETSP0052_2 /ASSEMBLY_ACC=CAM_ASM_000194 /LENGTH=360 /DNA_ID=CAMNT_0016320455 /DNA_START=184 /DNA_END=1263 /DNA_ORIENTATION=-
MARTSSAISSSSPKFSTDTNKAKMSDFDQIQILRKQYAAAEMELRTMQETAQWTIRQNKEVLMSLKQENKKVRNDLANQIRAPPGRVSLFSGSNMAHPNSRHNNIDSLTPGDGTVISNITSASSVIPQLENQIHVLRRQHDKLLQDKRTVALKLENVQDEISDLLKQAAGAAAQVTAAAELSTAPEAPPSMSSALTISTHHLTSEEQRSLRLLENKLEKVTWKGSEAHAVFKTLEEVLKKLQEEGPVLDACIRELQTAAGVAQEELEASQTGLREASRRRAKSMEALRQMEEMTTKERLTRKKVLDRYHSEASTLHSATQALLKQQFPERPVEFIVRNLREAGPNFRPNSPRAISREGSV